MHIYFTASNNGDGSASVEFFESKECITLLEEADPEGYGMGEGGGCMVFDGTQPPDGITVETLESVKERIEEMKEWL